MIGKRFRSLPFIFANDNYTLRILTFPTSTFASSYPKCVYTSNVVSISECPIRYCSDFGFIPALAILVQYVCLHTCGVIPGSCTECIRLYFPTICLKYFCQCPATFGIPFLSKNKNPILLSIIGSTFGRLRTFIIR